MFQHTSSPTSSSYARRSNGYTALSIPGDPIMPLKHTISFEKGNWRTTRQKQAAWDPDKYGKQVAVQL